jgi:hypothetical protein
MLGKATIAKYHASSTELNENLFASQRNDSRGHRPQDKLKTG